MYTVPVYVEPSSTYTVPVKVQPVADNVDGHAQLEEEHVLLVEHTQHHTQTHGASTVSQLVQHGPKLRGCRVENK